MNTFTTGVAQQIVGLPLFSGIGFRAAGLAVFYVIGLAGLYAYCRKIRRDPSLSLLSDEYMNLRKEDHTDGLEEMNIRRVLGLLAFLVVIVVQGYGCIRLGWSFPQIGAIYVILGTLLALIFNIGPSEACQLFCRGAVRVFARGLRGRPCPVCGRADEPGLHHGYDRARACRSFSRTGARSWPC